MPVPEAVQQGLEAWLKVHPLGRGVGLRDEQPLFVRLGRHGGQAPLPLSAVAVHRLVGRHRLTAGVRERLAHPHALRGYWATHLLEAGRAGARGLSAARARRPQDHRPLHRSAARVIDEIADVFDRRHQAARRAGWRA